MKHPYDLDTACPGCPVDRKYGKRFQQGVTRTKGSHHAMYNYKVKGVGASAEYLCAAQPTLDVLKRMAIFDPHITFTKTVTIQKVRQLRTAWQEFMKDPSEFVNGLLEVRRFLHSLHPVFLFHAAQIDVLTGCKTMGR